MRGTVVLILLVAALLPSVSGASSLRPAIAVLDRAPVVVRGTGFGVRERVLVTVSSGLLRASQRTTATYRGSFVARFEGVRLAGCNATLVATGARGHVARLKLDLRECPGPILDP